MDERFEILKKTLLHMLEEKKYTALRDILLTINPSDIAALFAGLPEQQVALLFRLLPKTVAADTFVKMKSEEQAVLIRGFSDSELKQIVDELYVDDATEDIEMMGGILPSEKPYLKSSPWELFKNRIPWLLLLMISATFTSMIITGFEDALSAQVALTAYIPMLMGTGGNSGSQTSVTIIRALSLGELRFANLVEVLWKEIRTAVLCSGVLAAVCFLKIWLVDSLLLGYPGIDLRVNGVVCLALAVTVLAAKTVGTLLPMGAKALGLDPAVMASPFITSIVDALSLLLYFLFARLLLGV